MSGVNFIDVAKTYEDGTRAVKGLNLEVKSGEFLVLVGPSGCGKTTTLRMLAGLEEVSEGEIRIDGAKVNDLPPKARDIGMVFQSYALYPHKSVEQNLTFGMEMMKGQEALSGNEIDSRVKEISNLLGIAELLGKRPKELSGGQRQRVALGRALIRRPKVLLMDEPLSNLDAKLRNQMRIELRRLHEEHGTTTVYVTHDQSEALTMSDRIVVFDDGAVQQLATPEVLYEKPENSFVAQFIGENNRLDGKVTAVNGDTCSVEVDGGMVEALADGLSGRILHQEDVDVPVGYWRFYPDSRTHNPKFSRRIFFRRQT